jgi:hypothetical protein
MVLTAVKHVHKFIVDRHDTGVCACGEIRQFMTGNTEKLKDKTYTVIHTGDPNYQDPVSTKVTNNIPENIPEKEKSMETALVETKKKGGSFREKHLFLESKKTDIIKDYQTLSWEQVMKNWELSDSGLRQVLTRWEVYKSKHPHKAKENKPLGKNRVNYPTDSSFKDLHLTYEAKTREILTETEVEIERLTKLKAALIAILGYLERDK